MSAPSFFRKAALEKLSTPEKLDQLITITGPKGWISFSTLALALLSGLTWGFNGKVKTKVDMVGVLLGGEVHNVVATSQGQVQDIEVSLGDIVNKGDVIASIYQPELLLQIESVTSNIKDLQAELAQAEIFEGQDNSIQAQLLGEKNESIRLQIASLEEKIGFTTQQLATEKELLKKGLTTRPQVVALELQLESSKNQVQDWKAQLTLLSSQKLQRDYSHQRESNLILQRISKEQRSLAQLRQRLDEQSFIRSPYDGEVIEILSSAGTIVGLGTPLFKVKGNAQIGTEELVAIMYVSSSDGKKIKKDMSALIVPSIVKPQEYGYVEADIEYVSEFPVTQQGMMVSMNNDQLVRGMLSLGAPYEVRVRLKRDSSTYSGYQWTSNGGPELQLFSGTSCMGKITVREEPPIALVVPALKKFFDLY